MKLLQALVAWLLVGVSAIALAAPTVETSVEAFNDGSITTLESASISLAGADRILYVAVFTGDAGTPADPTA